MRFGSMVSAVELILDAEVIELIQQIICPIRKLPQLVQQLTQGRVVDLPALDVVQHGLCVQQLHL
jgi:hypothetical protein